MTAALDLSLVPPLGEPRPQPVPVAQETTLPSGLRVVVVPRPGVPLIELRLRVPFAAADAPAARALTAHSSVLSGAVLLGTAERDQTGIAELLQSHGAELSVSADPDRLLFATTLLTSGLQPVLDLLAELLTGATYPDGAVEGERDRVAERIGIARSQPGVIARTALAARRYGEHPYAIQLPDTELVAAVDGSALRTVHRERIVPAGSTLVLVGDLDPQAATDAVGTALSGWSASGQAVEAPPAVRAVGALPRVLGWIVIVAVGGTGYALMGGMWSITWTDALQLVLIILGLIVLGYEILHTLGDGSLVTGLERLRTDPPAGHWRLADPETFSQDVLAALSALAIGALGNLPVQDLMQRVFSARSPRVATIACFLGAVGYLLMGLLPIGTGLAAGMLLSEVPEEGVVSAIAVKILSPPLLIIFLLAIVSAVLSTIVSAVMAPAAVLAHNLIEPALTARYGQLSTRRALLLQRGCAVAVAAASILLALSGQGAYELVQASYAMSLVGMFVPFVVGIYATSAPPMAANASLLVGIGSWLLHLVMGWEHFLEPFVPDHLPIPHELVDTALSAVAFTICWTWQRLVYKPP